MIELSNSEEYAGWLYPSVVQSRDSKSSPIGEIGEESMVLDGSPSLCEKHPSRVE